jgi:hypothetical protein
MNSLKVPLVSSIDLSGQTAVLALGGINASVKVRRLRRIPLAVVLQGLRSHMSPTLQVGDSFQNWTLQAVFQDTASQSLAVLELNFARWGLFVFRWVHSFYKNF